jgi:hypothetical protein
VASSASRVALKTGVALDVDALYTGVFELEGN